MSTPVKKGASTEQRMCAVSEDVLFWAFRYTLGRMTYSVQDVTTAITMNIANLTDKTARQMLKELHEAWGNNALGMEMDKEEWLKVINLLEKKVSKK